MAGGLYSERPRLAAMPGSHRASLTPKGLAQGDQGLKEVKSNGIWPAYQSIMDETVRFKS